MHFTSGNLNRCVSNKTNSLNARKFNTRDKGDEFAVAVLNTSILFSDLEQLIAYISECRFLSYFIFFLRPPDGGIAQS